MCNRCVVQIESLGSFRFETYAVDRDSGQYRDARADGGGVRADLGSSQNQTGIDICDSISAALCSFERFSKKNYGIGVLPLRIRRRKKAPISGAAMAPSKASVIAWRRTVSVRVAAESFVVRETDSADLQGNASPEFVRIEAVTDASLRSLLLVFGIVGEDRGTDYFLR